MSENYTMKKGFYIKHLGALVFFFHLGPIGAFLLSRSHGFQWLGKGVHWSVRNGK